MDEFSAIKDFPLEASVLGEPVKMVKTLADLQHWQRSEAYYNMLGFINGISQSLQGKRITGEMHVSETVQNLLDMFDTLNKYVDDVPPVDQPQRFGNKAYRSWSRKMHKDIFLLMQKALPQAKCHLFSELGFYLSESFGNSVRIDYGTGHELSFIFFLCALYKSEILEERDNVACGLKLFHSYILLVRRLQKTYRMEPAGSQGVWSLDDYQFVPFIWGSAQLALKAPFEPAQFLDEEIINKYKDDYMFIGCIDYINQMKTGHFAEHSNQLWSISAVPTWSKINSGLVKMYQKEILSKFPIIQHVYFGKLMSFEPVLPGTTIHTARLGFEMSNAKKLLIQTKLHLPPLSSTSAVSLASSEKPTVVKKVINPTETKRKLEEQQSKASNQQPTAKQPTASEPAATTTAAAAATVKP